MGRWAQRAHELAARSRDTSNTPDYTDRIDTTAREDAEVAWRVAAFRAAIPAHGPIWPPKLRHCPETDTPGHCSLCGDALVARDLHDLPPQSAPRFPRCQLCVAALWLALTDVRERDGGVC